MVSRRQIQVATPAGATALDPASEANGVVYATSAAWHFCPKVRRFVDPCLAPSGTTDPGGGRVKHRVRRGGPLREARCRTR
jgi:hypothetical protein